MSKTYHEQQQEEIATIKERTITLRLSDADMERVFSKASEEGITVPELLQNFIGDLVDGTYSNGSDERDYAQQWFERCWFGGHMEKTFSQFLIGHDQLESVVELWNELQMAKDDLLEAIERPEQCEPEDFDAFEEVIADCLREMNELFSEYRGCESIMPEQEMISVLEWHRQKTEWLEQRKVERNIQAPQLPAKGALAEKLEKAKRECNAAKQEQQKGHASRQSQPENERS